MNLATKSLALGLTAVLTLTSISLAQGRRAAHRDGDTRAPRTEAGRHAGRGEARADHRFERRQRARQFVRSLEFSEAQRVQALNAAKAVAPVADAARAEARRIVEEARKANPNATRAELRAAVRGPLGEVKERTRAQILPQGQALLGSLTPEQRAKIQAAAEKHGRTFDEERVAKRLAFFLSRKNAVEHLERRVQTGENRTR